MPSKEQGQGKKEISDTVAASRFWAPTPRFEENKKGSDVAMLFAAAALCWERLFALTDYNSAPAKDKNNTKRTLSGSKQPARKRKTIGHDSVALITFIHILFLLPEALTLA